MFLYLKKSMSVKSIRGMLHVLADKRGSGSMQYEYIRAMSELALEVLQEGERVQGAQEVLQARKLKSRLLRIIRDFRYVCCSVWYRQYFLLSVRSKHYQPYLAAIHILVVLTRGLKWLSLSRHDRARTFDTFIKHLQTLYHILCALSGRPLQRP